MISLLTTDMAHRPWWYLDWSIFDNANGRDTPVSIDSNCYRPESAKVKGPCWYLTRRVTPFIEYGLVHAPEQRRRPPGGTTFYSMWRMQLQ